MAARGKRILLLGGTGEARDLAGRLSALGHDVISSLAGVTMSPVLPDGTVHVGGFGGLSGLSRFLREEAIGLIADATHPFAVRISANAVEAARAAGIAYLRLERPAWTAGKGDEWLPAEDIEEAARLIAPRATAFVTVGRQEIAPFLARGDARILARMIDPPDISVPERALILLARPPFTLQSERALMRKHEVSVVVTKNSGGAATEAKLAAARRLHLPVIMIERPEKPDAETVETVEEMVDRIAALAGR